MVMVHGAVTRMKPLLIFTITEDMAPATIMGSGIVLITDGMEAIGDILITTDPIGE